MQIFGLYSPTFLRILKLSLYFSTLLIISTTIIGTLFLRSYKTNEIDNIIKTKLNLVTPIIDLHNNYPLLVKELRNETKVDSIAIFKSDCTPLASSSWRISKKECLSSKKNIQNLFMFGSESLLINYNFSINYFQKIKDNSKVILIVFFSFFAISFIGIFVFTITTFLKPIQEIENSIQSNKPTRKNFNEFGLVNKKLSEFKDLVAKSEKEKAMFELARTVIHDIRNPLQVIEVMLEDKKSNSENVIQKINEINHHIKKLVSSPFKEIIIIDLCKLTSEITQESQSLYVNIEVKFILETECISSYCSYFDLKNVLSNLIKNSFEASATKILINFSHHKQSILIKVADNGSGIQESDLQNLFVRNFTKKNNGNGIGLSGIKFFLESIKGTIQYSPSVDNWTQFIIKIPSSERSSMVILIDDDKFIRTGWSLAAQKKQINFQSFKNVEDFFLSSDKVPLNSQIYIDSNLGSDIKGELRAKDIYQKGYKSIFLATGYIDIRIDEFPWISGLVTKSPPF